MMGYVAGPVHTNVRAWWVAVHNNFGIGVSTESSFTRCRHGGAS
jgi:hypothetical protein